MGLALQSLGGGRHDGARKQSVVGARGILVNGNGFRLHDSFCAVAQPS